MKRRAAKLSITVLVLLYGSAPSAQNTSATRQTVQVDDLLSQLRSSEWQQRSEAVDRLVSDPEAMKSRAVKNALIELIERENLVIDRVFRESKGKQGVSTVYGEEYSEYYSALFDAVAEFDDSRALKALARGSYNPDAEIVAKLAANWEVVGPVMVELARGDISPHQDNALAVLTQIVKVPQFGPSYGAAMTTIKNSLDPRRFEFAHQEWQRSWVERFSDVLPKEAGLSWAIAGGRNKVLSDLDRTCLAVSSESVGRLWTRTDFSGLAVAERQENVRARIQGIRVVGLTGNKNTIPLLEKVVKSDPEPSVRQEALKAIVALRAIAEPRPAAQ